MSSPRRSLGENILHTLNFERFPLLNVIKAVIGSALPQTSCAHFRLSLFAHVDLCFTVCTWIYADTTDWKPRNSVFLSLAESEYSIILFGSTAGESYEHGCVQWTRRFQPSRRVSLSLPTTRQSPVMNSQTLSLSCGLSVPCPHKTPMQVSLFVNKTY